MDSTEHGRQIADCFIYSTGKIISCLSANGVYYNWLFCIILQDCILALALVGGESILDSTKLKSETFTFGIY